MEENSLLVEYTDIINNWKKDNSDASVLDLFDRGLVICQNEPKSDVLLLSGINPSFDEKVNNRQNIIFEFAKAEDRGHSKYWSKKHNQFGGKAGDLVQNNMAYMDLFPLKQSTQSRFESVLREYKDLRMSLLAVTKSEIERLNPKLIVHANKGSLYYWGLNPYTFQKDEVNPWLNYAFSEIPLHKPLQKYVERISSIPENKRFVHLYRISGNGLSTEAHYFLSYVMEYFGMKDWQRIQLLSPEEMADLWNWCKVF